MKKDIKKLWGSGQLNFLGVLIDAYVLDDGTALIGKSKILEVLKVSKGGDRTERPRFLNAKNITPFISPELEEKLKGIEFKHSGKTYSAYPADILPMVCNVYLEAREAGVLQPNQKIVAQQCEILVRSFAKVGIVALIYEQLGFEKFKNPEAFRILIESYLSDEIRKWSKEFPDELFFQMNRIYGNEKTTSQNRPQYYAKFIRKYIYEPIERGKVLKRLDEKTPRNDKGRKKKKLFQSASEDIGLPAIRSQIWQTVGVLKTSANKRKFENNFEKLLGQSYQGDLFEDGETNQ